PASYPFTLRYGQEMAARLAQPAAIEGPIVSPWRVVMVASDLDALVNCDIVHNVSPPPSPQLFPSGFDTEWVKPGRAVWKYLDGGGDGTLEVMKEFSRLAGELGFEYNLLEGFWQRWPESDLRELVDYSRQRNVGIWLWKHSRDIRDPSARQAFFEHAHDVGAVGVKLDFFDHEAKEVIDVYQAALRGAAEHKLMVDFHGANKPTGESRTWPNEMTREAVSGMERRSMPAWSEHTTTVPFTRMLAGHLDFTPMVFGERRRETSWAHQIATAAIFTSPLLVYGAHPRSMLDNPAVEMIKSIPSVWDETRVLPSSEIGHVAAFARRRVKQWYVVIANGPDARSVTVPLSFLGRGTHSALLVRDDRDDAAAVKVESTSMGRGDLLHVDLRAGGGFIGRFS
ncbi:MAG TPA: glycoside hydrolase family 97 catalytic domain-containing protein, partial [Gemmatimonadaceae bacterium]